MTREEFAGLTATLTTDIKALLDQMAAWTAKVYNNANNNNRNNPNRGGEPIPVIRVCNNIPTIVTYRKSKYANESDLEYYERRYYSKLTDDYYEIEISYSVYRCPFCYNKDYSLSDLLRHAFRIAGYPCSRKMVKDIARHSVLITYILRILTQLKEKIDVAQTTESFPTSMKPVEEHSVTEPVVSIVETDEHMVSLCDGKNRNDVQPKEELEEKETEEPEVIEEQFEEIKEEEPVEKEQTAEKYKFVYDAVLNEEVTNDEVYHETVPLVPNNIPAVNNTEVPLSEEREEEVHDIVEVSQPSSVSTPILTDSILFGKDDIENSQGDSKQSRIPAKQVEDNEIVEDSEESFICKQQTPRSNFRFTHQEIANTLPIGTTVYSEQQLGEVKFQSLSPNHFNVFAQSIQLS